MNQHCVECGFFLPRVCVFRDSLNRGWHYECKDSVVSARFGNRACCFSRYGIMSDFGNVRVHYKCARFYLSTIKRAKAIKGWKPKRKS